MKRSTIIWLIVAASLFLIGVMVFGGAMYTMNWEFSKLATEKVEINRHELTESFQNITLSTVTADVTFQPTTDGKTTVVCHEFKNMKHTVTVEDNTLVVKLNDTRKWYDHIGIFSDSSAITVYLPAGEYGDVTVKATAGNIQISALNIDALDLSVTSGDCWLTDIACTRLSFHGVSGDINMKNVTAADSLILDTTTGDVNFNGCDAPSISVNLTTGDVTGSLRTGKNFDVGSVTGDIHVPPSSGTGKCKIRLTTGDVCLTVQ